MTWLALPSFVLLLLKLGLFWKAHNNDSFTRDNIHFTILFVSLFLLNAIEFLSFTLLAYLPPYVLLLLFYVSLVVALAALNVFALQLHHENTRNKVVLWYGLAISLSLLIVFTPMVINGIVSIKYTMTRVPGDHYWLFQVYALVAFIYASIVLSSGGLKKDKTLRQKRGVVLFIALLPFIIGISAVIIAMAAGAKVNALLVTSIALLFFMAAMVYTCQSSNIFKFLSCIPHTPEYKVKRKMHVLIDDLLSETLADRNANLKYTLNSIEMQVIEILNQHCINTRNIEISHEAHKAVAQLIGLTPNTIYKKLNK